MSYSSLSLIKNSAHTPVPSLTRVTPISRRTGLQYYHYYFSVCLCLSGAISGPPFYFFFLSFFRRSGSTPITHVSINLMSKRLGVHSRIINEAVSWNIGAP